MKSFAMIAITLLLVNPTKIFRAIEDAQQNADLKTININTNCPQTHCVAVS